MAINGKAIERIGRIIVIIRLFMVPHLVRARSANEDIRIRSFYHTHGRTYREREREREREMEREGKTK